MFVRLDRSKKQSEYTWRLYLYVRTLANLEFHKLYIYRTCGTSELWTLKYSESNSSYSKASRDKASISFGTTIFRRTRTYVAVKNVLLLFNALFEFQ